MRNNFKKIINSIGFQLHLFFNGTIVLISTFILIFFFVNIREILVKQIGQSRLDVLYQVAERSNFIKGNIVTTSNLYRYDDKILDLLKYEPSKTLNDVYYLDNLHKNYNNIFKDVNFQHNIIIIGNNNFTYSSFQNDNYDFERLKSELWYKKSYYDKKEIIFVSFLEKIKNNRSVFGAFRKIIDDEGNNLGIILITVDENILENIYNSTEHKSNFYIFDKKGNIVSSINKSLLGKNFINVDNFSKFYGKTGTNIIKKLGIDYILTNYYDPQTEWTIVEEIPFDIIFNPFYKEIFKFSIVLIGFIIIALILCHFYANKIIKPIKLLCNYMKNFKQRNFEIIGDIKGYEEVIELKNNFNTMSSEIKTLLIDIKNNEEAKRKSDIDFLRAQINPHFLYNTLFSIQCMVELNKNKKASSMISAFIELLRKTLNLDTELIPLSEEFENTKKYLILQQIKYQDKINFELDIDDASKNCFVPALIIQPIVENAIFHGIEAKNETGLVIVESTIKDNNLIISVSDNGVGLLKQQLEILNNQIKNKNFKKSIGLFNVINRIKINFGSEYGLKIESEYGIGTTISMSFPIIFKNGENNNESINC